MSVLPVFLCLLLKLCSAFLCSNCSRPYNFITNSNEVIKVGSCPSGYTLEGFDCQPRLEELIIIDSNFSLVSSFNSSTVDDFSTSFGTFNTLGNPFPTIDRGFYFPLNSHLKTSTNFIPSPCIHIEFMVRLITYGEIIAVIGDSPFLKLGSSNDEFYLNYRYCNNQNNCVLVKHINNIILDKGIWICIAFSIEQLFDNIFQTMIIYSDSLFSWNATEGQNSISAFNNLEIYTWTIGEELNGFSGFFYYLKVFNKNVDNLPRAATSPNICDPYFYFDQGNCVYCTGCPVEGIWCIGSNSCSPCFEDTCSSCTGYNENECLESSEECINDCSETCDSSCSLCNGPDLDDCIACKVGLFKVEGFCIACPSLSSITNDNECEIFLGQIFSATFDTLSGIIYDKLKSVPVITGNSEAFYPNYDTEDPIAAIKRGFYFNGNSSVLRLPEYNRWTNPKLVLSLNWTVEIWLNPKSKSGCFFSYEGPEYSLISLCYSNSQVLVSISSLLYLTKTFDIELSMDNWKALIISFEFNGDAIISVFLDNIEISIVSSRDSFVPNYLANSYFEIGKSSKEYFTGFIYQLSIFSNKPNYYERSHYYCDGYLIDSCLVNCEIHEFHIGPGYNDCGSCHSSCSEGCRRNDSCSLCNDPLCYECFDFNSTFCDKCSFTTKSNGECGCPTGTILDFEVHECTICEERQFYNLFTCEDCSNLCISCENKNTCLVCVENASIIDGKCLCDLGFNGTIECARAEFRAKIIASDENDVYIEFEDELLTEFDSSYISVSTSKISVESVKIEQWSLKIFKIKLNFSSGILKEATVKIEFKKKIFSVYNSQLTTSTLTGRLQPEEIDSQYKKEFSDSKKTSTTITIASVTSSIGLALASPDPACLWSLINIIQMLCFISLSSLSLGPKFSGKLKGLEFYNLSPDIFSYFVPRTEGIRPFDKAYEYGYRDHLILFNISGYIFIFIVMLCFLIITILFSKLTKCKPFSYELIKRKINSQLASYNYGNFIRFWITCYIDIFASALIGIMTEGKFSTAGTVNFTFCIIFTLFVAATPLIIFYFTYKKQHQIFDKNSGIHAKWGTLFYEFRNDNSIGSIQFYFYFFMRRIFYIIILLFIQDSSIVQVSLIMTLSACVRFMQNFVYLVMLRPYKEKVLNISNCVSEFIYTFIFVLLIINQLKISSTLRVNIDYALVELVNSIMGIQIFASVCVFAQFVFLKIKQKLKNNNSVLPEHTRANIETIPQIKQDELA